MLFCFRRELYLTYFDDSISRRIGHGCSRGVADWPSQGGLRGPDGNSRGREGRRRARCRRVRRSIGRGGGGSRSVAIVVDDGADEAVGGEGHVGFVACFDKDKPIVHEQIVVSGKRRGHGVEQTQGTVGVDVSYGAYAVDLAVHDPVAPAA